MATLRSIEVKDLNSTKADEIRQALKAAEEDGSKVIELNFNASKGDVSISICLIQDIHASKSDCKMKSSGLQDLASSLLISGGQFGERKTDMAATFALFEDMNSPGKKRGNLTANEKNALELMGQFSGGKKSRIKKVMLDREIITSTELKSLGLIDEITGFIDKYANARQKAKDSKDKDKDSDEEINNKETKNESKK